ncbi:hypothetical protein RJ641_024413, partial [Dillenia turbinata]
DLPCPLLGWAGPAFSVLPTTRDGMRAPSLNGQGCEGNIAGKSVTSSAVVDGIRLVNDLELAILALKFGFVYGSLLLKMKKFSNRRLACLNDHISNLPVENGTRPCKSEKISNFPTPNGIGLRRSEKERYCIQVFNKNKIV